jgi:CBS domain-containing protein
MTLVSEAMDRSPLAVAPETSLREAAALAARTGAVHLLVLDEGNLVGILCACELAPEREGEQVWERMSLPVLTVRPDVSVEDAAMTLCECGVGCLPVAVGGLVLGTVGEPELARAGVQDLPPHHRCRAHRVH